MKVNIGTNQGNCPVGTCSNNTLRESGCFICSNGGDGDECVTCLNNHIVFNGRCVGCLGMEDCPFNNSDEVECVDGNDLSHCNQSNATGCSDHVCLYGNCSNGIVEGDEECEIGGRGCRGCVCMDGWHSNGTKDCVTECGDGTVAGSEECEIGGSGCDENCSCGDEWSQGVSGSMSCVGKCGDGHVVGSEECDSGRGCSSVNCRCGSGWYPSSPAEPSCHSFCGDGHVVGSEQCEIGGDGCDDECSCGRGWYSNMSMNCSSVCGDGIWVSDEECDSSAGCGDDCNCSVGWKGNGYGICKEVCGDGVVVGHEECDSTPGCNSVHCVCENNHPLNNESGLCMICGNGIVEGSEECDMNDIHCNNQTCKCMSGYSLRNVSSSSGDGDGGRRMMICVELKKKNDVIVIVVIVVIIIMMIVVVVVILMIYVVGKKKKNDGGWRNGDYVEMDDESLYEVEMERGKRGVLVIGETLYDNATTLVYKGVVDGKKDVVVKVMKMWGSKLDSGQAREMELMRRLKSDYVVMYYGTSVISGRVGIVMEYMALGSLERLMSVCVMSGELKVRYVREICCGMMYLHSMKIIHRDLKPSNVLVVGDDVGWSGVICKISDFGTSREMDISTTMSMSQSMTMTSNIGTPLYMAPEILSGGGHYSQKSDVYSYGVLMVSLWNQKPPYSEMSGIEVGDLLSGITNRGVRPGIESSCPQSYFNLAHACMVEDSHSRPSFSEIWKNVFDS